MPTSSWGFALTSLLCLSCTFFLPFFFFKTPVQFHVPFLVLCLYRYSMKKSIWIALVTGFFVDCLFSYERLGWVALSYLFTSFITYRLKNFFFQDSVWTLALITYIYSFFSNGIQMGLTHLFDPIYPTVIQWTLSDWIITPSFDAFFSLISITFPLLLLRLCSLPHRKMRFRSSARSYDH